MEQNRGEADSQQNGANASDDQSLQKIATSIEAIAASTCKSDAEKLEEKTEKDRKATHDKKASYLQAGSVFISSVAVGLSIVGILISSKQMSIANKALDQATISAGAASISAQAATKSSQVAEEAFSVNSRPYLTAMLPDTIDIDIKYPTKIKIDMKNVGVSPANLIMNFLAIYSSRGIIEEDKVNDELKNNFEYNKYKKLNNVIEKGETQTIVFFTEPFPDVMYKPNEIYIKAQVIYLGFNSKRYSKRICAVYDLENNIYKFNRFCKVFNDDDEYKK